MRLPATPYFLLVAIVAGCAQPSIAPVAGLGEGIADSTSGGPMRFVANGTSGFRATGVCNLTCAGDLAFRDSPLQVEHAITEGWMEVNWTSRSAPATTLMNIVIFDGSEAVARYEAANPSNLTFEPLPAGSYDVRAYPRSPAVNPDDEVTWRLVYLPASTTTSR